MSSRPSNRWPGAMTSSSFKSINKGRFGGIGSDRSHTQKGGGTSFIVSSSRQSSLTPVNLSVPEEKEPLTKEYYQAFKRPEPKKEELSKDEMSWRLGAIYTHTAALFIHWITCCVMIILFLTVFEGDGIFLIEIYSFSDAVHVDEYSIVWMIVAQLALSAMQHLFVVLQWNCRCPRQLCCVDVNMILRNPGPNIARWVEYSASAGLMTWIVATLSGMTSLFTLCSLLFLNIIMQSSGAIMEILMWTSENNNNSERIQSAVGFIGWFSHLAIWMIIFSQFFVSIGTADESPPALVWTIIFALFILFTGFGVTSVWYSRSYVRPEGPENERIKQRTHNRILFYKSEVFYSIQSLFSKSLLAYLLIGGALNSRPST